MGKSKQPPGEVGGRRRIGKDRGTPRAGDGVNRSTRGKIPGRDVEFRTPGGKIVGRGGFFSTILRGLGHRRGDGQHSE